MDNDLKLMLQKTGVLNVVVGIILSTIIMWFFNYNNAIIFIIGLIVAYGSFYLNGFTSNYFLKNNSSLYKTFVVIGFILRVLIVSVIGLIIFRHNKFSIISYMFGYSSHFISIIIYGLTNNK